MKSYLHSKQYEDRIKHFIEGTVRELTGVDDVFVCTAWNKLPNGRRMKVYTGYIGNRFIYEFTQCGLGEHFVYNDVKKVCEDYLEHRSEFSV